MFCSKTIKKKIVKYSTSQLTTIQTSPLIDKEPTDKDLPISLSVGGKGFCSYALQFCCALIPNSDFIQQLFQGNNKCYLSISISYHLNIETKFLFF